MSAGQPPYLSFIINERPYSIRPVKFSPMLYYERKVLYLPLPKPCPCGPFQILSWHVPERAYVIIYPSLEVHEPSVHCKGRAYRCHEVLEYSNKVIKGLNGFIPCCRNVKPVVFEPVKPHLLRQDHICIQDKYLIAMALCYAYISCLSNSMA